MTTISDYPVPDRLDDPKFREFFGYWKKLGKNSGCARRIDFDPLAVPTLLGWFNVAKVERSQDCLRFRFTLWGSNITQLFDGDFTGRYVDEIMMPTPQGEVNKVFEIVTNECRPHFWEVPVPRPNRNFTSYRRLALPFMDEQGEKVSHIIALMLPSMIPKT